MDNSNVRPLFDRVLIKREEPKDVVQGGIVIPDSAKEKPLEGIVVAVGEGKRNPDGNGFLAPVVTIGDKVLISKYGGTEIKVLTEDYVIVREDDILAIVN